MKDVDLSLTPMEAVLDLLPSPEEYATIFDRLQPLIDKIAPNNDLRACLVMGFHLVIKVPVTDEDGAYLKQLRDVGVVNYGRLMVPSTPEHWQVVQTFIGKAQAAGVEIERHLSLFYMDYEELTGRFSRREMWLRPTAFADPTPPPYTLLDNLSGGICDRDDYTAGFQRELEHYGLSACYMPLHRLTFWQMRELARITSGEYTAIPAEVSRRMDPEILLKEIPHLAVKGSNKGKVAYTESAQKGLADVQSVMKPGKYLRRVLKDSVNDQELKDLVADLYDASNLTVHTTNDPKEMARVYMEGPDSCMAHGQGRFAETFRDGEWLHPVEAYAHPESHIQLAWVEAQGRPAARALINTSSMTHVTVYTADWCKAARTTLNDWLMEEGYRFDPDALRGEPMSVIVLDNGGILSPYIDHGGQGVDYDEDDEETMVIGGPFCAPYDKGFFHPDPADDEDRAMCDECNELHDLEDVCNIDDYGVVCDCCRVDNFVEAFVNGSDYTRTIRDTDASYLDMVAHSPNDSADYVHEDFDEWHRLDVLPHHDEGYIPRDVALELLDVDGDGVDEYISRDEAWTDESSAPGPDRAPEFVAYGQGAIDIDYVWFNATTAQWVLTVEQDPEDEEDLIQVNQYTWRERDSADDAIDECA